MADAVKAKRTRKAKAAPAPAAPLPPISAEDVAAWPAQAVEQRAVEGLKAYERNSRTHSEEQVAQIAASIREWGWTQPLLVDEDGTVIAGHGRLLAARKLGLTEVPVMVAAGWSEAQRRAYVIADNQLALNAGWDDALLAAEIQALSGAFDLSLVGFGSADLAELLKAPTQGQTDPDEAPPLEEVNVSRRGDVWILGRNRLRCGDSTNPADVAALLAGAKPVLMVTDPPYGVVYDPSWRNEAMRADGTKVGARATGKVLNDDKADWTAAWELFPGSVAYVWHGALHNVTVSESLIRAGFEIRAQIVWIKLRHAISRGHYHWQHEPGFYAERPAADLGAEAEEAWSVDHGEASYVVRAGKTAGWRGGRKQTTVWFIEHLKNETGHGTQKPVDAMRRPIVNNSLPGEGVYEPFSGSGTTFIAGEMEGRPVFGMELSERYVDVIVRRWQAFTGKVATLEGSALSFADVTAARAAERAQAGASA